jgi:hypothetical protein
MHGMDSFKMIASGLNRLVRQVVGSSEELLMKYLTMENGKRRESD